MEVYSKEFINSLKERLLNIPQEQWTVEVFGVRRIQLHDRKDNLVDVIMNKYSFDGMEVYVDPPCSQDISIGFKGFTLILKDGSVIFCSDGNQHHNLSMLYHSLGEKLSTKVEEAYQQMINQRKDKEQSLLDMIPSFLIEPDKHSTAYVIKDIPLVSYNTWAKMSTESLQERFHLHDLESERKIRQIELENRIEQVKQRSNISQPHTSSFWFFWTDGCFSSLLIILITLATLAYTFM